MKLIFTTPQKRMLAAALGLSAAFGTGQYLKNQERKIQNRYVMTTVLQTKKYIREGKPVTPDLVDEIPIPVAYLQPTALQHKSDLQNNKGDPMFTARVGLLKGEQISKSKLSDVAALQGLAWALPAGQTALSVKLNMDQAVAGLIQPGDRVNVNCTTEKQTKILLSRVRVVAMDSQIWDPESSSGPSPKSKDGLTDSVLVTFSLTPREAALLSLATDKGHLQLALTSPLETTSALPSVVELIDLR